MRCQLDGKREELERVYRKGEEWRGWGENEVGGVTLGVERVEWGGKGEGECREGVRVGWG